MTTLRHKRKPTFLWQGVLLVLPILLLVTLGFWFLRREKLLAEGDAKERAQLIAETQARRFSADDLLQALLNAWWDASGASRRAPRLQGYTVEKWFPKSSQSAAVHSPAMDELVRTWPASQYGDVWPDRIELAPNGDILQPPPLQFAPPQPQLLLGSQLSLNQLVLWQSAREAENRGPPASAVEAFTRFLASSPPAPFTAAARFSLGQACLRDDRQDAAADSFRELIRRYPEALSEAGLPLRLLAELQLTRMQVYRLFTNSPASTQAAGRLIDTLCSNAVFHPSFLSPLLIDEALRLAPQASLSHDWKGWWETDQQSRDFLEALQADLAHGQPAEHGFWTHWNDKDWLVICSQSRNLETNAPGTFKLLVFPELIVRHAAAVLVLGAKVKVPDYFGTSVALFGKQVLFVTNDSGVIAAVTAPFPLLRAENQALRLAVHLTDRPALYARQRQTTLWFAALLLASAAAATVGFLGAYRSFHRQLRLSEMKSNFVSSVSHELRAPIASVRLMAESLERGKISEPSKQQEYFRFIGQECRRLSSLIANVLDFSRIEQGRKQYEFEPTDLLALTHQTVKLMETYAAERQVTLALALPGPRSSSDHHLSVINYQLNVDGKALQQALINLIDNAVKHSPKGQTVTIGLEASNSPSPAPQTHHAPRMNPESFRGTDHAARLVLLWVEDHGEGIPSQEHEKIFERFYRLGSELRRETQGVGIGLSIVKHVVEAHNGRALVRSALGQGSRFTIELPWPSLNPNSETRNPRIR